MTKENSYNADYGGLRVHHSGDWDKTKYHDHNRTHLDRHQLESSKRQMKPIPRKRSKLDAPKPQTAIVDLGSNTKTVVEPQIEKANLNDLKNKGLK